MIMAPSERATPMVFRDDMFGFSEKLRGKNFFSLSFLSDFKN